MRVLSVLALIAVLASPLPATAAPIRDFNVFAQKQLIGPRASVTIRFSFTVDAFSPETLLFNPDGSFGTVRLTSLTELRYVNAPFSTAQYAAGAWAPQSGHTYVVDLWWFTPPATVPPGVYGLSITNAWGGSKVFDRDVTWTVQAVPEPPGLSLLVIAGAALVWRHQRRIRH
jgi:hypothetical protein